jgi:nucleotide-binding universal stress UspA family protein
VLSGIPVVASRGLPLVGGAAVPEIPSENLSLLSEVAMRLDTILIGMDFSPAAIATANWVTTALAPQAKIVLVHAVEPPGRPSFLAPDTLPLEALEADARSRAADRLREIAHSIGERVVKTEVRIGRADEAAANLAVETSADLIVVGPHGNREHKSMLLGTTADSLVRGAPVPVLVGSRAPEKGRTRVVAAVQDAPVMTVVFAWADYAATQLGGRLTVIHALETAAYSHMASLAAAHARGDPAVEKAEVEGELRWQALRWLRQCTASGIDPSRVDPLVEYGPAAEAILRIARRQKAALIVIGRHGGLRGLPARLGRTVRHVLHDARAAVLVVPPIIG